MPSLSNNELSITIKAVDDASPALASVRKNIDGLGNDAEASEKKTAGFNDSWYAFAAATAAAGGAYYSLAGEIETAISAANNLNNAVLGLNTVASYFGQDSDKATAAAKSLAADGLMTVTDAATSLKNLLASGFSLPQAIDIINRFKDTAAFGRQASLGFGEAIAGATEGIKNGNSILSDNAGMTKNLGVILQEAGYNQQDLGKASSDAGIRWRSTTAF